MIGLNYLEITVRKPNRFCKMPFDDVVLWASVTSVKRVKLQSIVDFFKDQETE